MSRWKNISYQNIIFVYWKKVEWFYELDNIR